MTASVAIVSKEARGVTPGCYCSVGSAGFSESYETTDGVHRGSIGIDGPDIESMP